MRRSMRRRAMSRSLFVLAFCVLLVQGACTQSGSQGSEDRLPVVIETLVGQLGAPEDDVRRDAVEKLIQIGPDVLSLVKKTRDETDDPEVRYRCDEVLKGIARNFPPIGSLFEISDWGRGFPEGRREPIVHEAIRRLRITRHDDTVVDALNAIYHACNGSVDIDVVPVVEPFALEGSTRVRSMGIVALSRAASVEGEYDRCFFAVSRALVCGDRELEKVAILRMQRFNDPDDAP